MQIARSCSGEIQSRSRFLSMDSPEKSMSVTGDMQMPAGGRGRPWSRAEIRRESTSVPPADIPTGTMWCGLYPLASRKRYAATASSTAAGKTCSGASR